MEEYNTLVSCIELAEKSTKSPGKLQALSVAREWLDRVAAREYEINARLDHRTENEIV